jgi:hypothetical protein
MKYYKKYIHNYTKQPKKMNSNSVSNFASKKCSFCRSSSHNITLCDDIRLNEIELLFAIKYYNMNSIQQFNSWLTLFAQSYRIIIKAFANKKKITNSKTNIQNCISKISEYIDTYYENNNNLPTYMEEIIADYIICIDKNDKNQMRIILCNIILEFLDSSRHKTETIITLCDKFDIIENEILLDNCDCNICMDNTNITDLVKLGCNHIFCKVCIKTTLQYVNKNCALCRKNIETIQTQTYEIYGEFTRILN